MIGCPKKPTGKSEKVVFKQSYQSQGTMFPMYLGDMIATGHQVRFINEVIDQMNIDDLLAGYKGSGTSSYHPRLMLKIFIYGFVERIYSSRKIAKALRENIHFMWLAGGLTPDFRTINLFRKSRLRSSIKELFTQVVELLVERGLVDLNTYFVDGTTVRADASRYTAVWKKNVERYEGNVREQIGELFEQIQQLCDLEDEDFGDKDLS